MTLTDLATHICEQSAMNDADDVSAAKMFLQRRLEMIWNTQLWRASLIEATLTVNPDGTATLADTVWIPSRGTLLLPTAFDSVLAVRQDAHSMSVASLESYYRTDTDWLNMQGDPTEFQVLSPAVWEFGAANTFLLQPSNTADNKLSASIRTVDGSGVVKATNTVALASPISTAFSALRIDTMSIPSTQGNVSLLAASGYNLVPQGATYPNDTEEYDVAGLLTPGKAYVIIWGANDTYFNYGQADTDGNFTQIPKPGAGMVSVFFYPANGAYAVFGIGISHSTPVTGQLFATATLFTLNAGTNIAQLHQRIRLTTRPQLATNLRVLGKTVCPILGAYDEAPINNVEPALMAFARGDMLLRARQNGKAQIAAQEGASLLAQLARSEAFQQASSFRIVPDVGFGGDNFGWTQPNSLHPL